MSLKQPQPEMKRPQKENKGRYRSNATKERVCRVPTQIPEYNDVENCAPKSCH